MNNRLDLYMYSAGLAESRSKARELICGGAVAVNGETVGKPSAPVPDGARVSVSAYSKYAGRAGYKLETAVEAFGIRFTDLTCLDAGAGAGGFTDLMLQNGARRVYAADVGENQLHPSLRENPRVISMEKQDIRTLVLPEKVDFITADLSFISLRQVVPSFGRLLKSKGECAVLIKPQFEAGKIRMKNGILKDEKLIAKIVCDTERFITELGYEIIGTVPSKLNEKGKNREYITYIIRSNDL